MLSLKLLASFAVLCNVPRGTFMKFRNGLQPAPQIWPQAVARHFFRGLEQRTNGFVDYMDLKPITAVGPPKPDAIAMLRQTLRSAAAPEISSFERGHGAAVFALPGTVPAR
jgi:hypothetical protein